MHVIDESKLARAEATSHGAQAGLVSVDETLGRAVS